MKTLRSRVFVLSFIFIFAAMVASLYAQTATATPAPNGGDWYMHPDEVQKLALEWIAVLTVVAAALSAFVAKVIGTLNEVKAKVAGHDDRLTAQGDRLHEIALATPPPAATDAKTGPGAGAAVAVILALFVNGCASLANFLESPANQEILKIASSAASASIVSAIGGNGKLTPEQRDAIQAASSAAINGASSAAVFGLAEIMRSKQTTADAATAKGIADAAKNAGTPQLALPVAQAVASVAKTAPPDVANAAVADALAATAFKMRAANPVVGKNIVALAK